MNLDNDSADADIEPTSEFGPRLREILCEAGVILVILASCVAAIFLSGCGGSTAEDETKSTQPVVCPSDRSTCA